LPPPCEPAKEGIDTSMKAEAKRAIAIFIETPFETKVKRKNFEAMS
jgi:hypothetical protein